MKKSAIFCSQMVDFRMPGHIYVCICMYINTFTCAYIHAYGLTSSHPCSVFFAGVHQSRRLTPIISLYSSTALDIASMDHPPEIITCYHTWILQLHNHMKEVPTAIQVPPQASHIHTPMIIHRWQEALFKHPHQPLLDFFLIAISQGFRIGFNHFPDELKYTHRNLTGAP